MRKRGLRDTNDQDDVVSVAKVLLLRRICAMPSKPLMVEAPKVLFALTWTIILGEVTRCRHQQARRREAGGFDMAILKDQDRQLPDDSAPSDIEKVILQCKELLSFDDIELLRRLAEGKSRKSIAKSLGIHEGNMSRRRKHLIERIQERVSSN